MIVPTALPQTVEEKARWMYESAVPRTTHWATASDEVRGYWREAAQKTMGSTVEQQAQHHYESVKGSFGPNWDELGDYVKDIWRERVRLQLARETRKMKYVGQPESC